MIDSISSIAQMTRQSENESESHWSRGQLQPMLSVATSTTRKSSVLSKAISDHVCVIDVSDRRNLLMDHDAKQ